MLAGSRPTIDLKEKKDEILKLVRQGTTYDNITAQVGTKERTLRQRLTEWGI
jgi:hypothetical protein